MKRFDKGYVYSALLSDLFSSLVIVLLFLEDLFLDEEAVAGDVVAAIPVLAIAVAVVYLCFIIYRILYYRTSGYELTEREIRCNRGVLFRKRSLLDYKRIHAINKKQSLFHRIFGIAVLTVDSGSTSAAHQPEITIVEKAKTVDALLEELNALRESGVRAADTKGEVLLSDKDSLYRFTSGRKMLYTLISIVSTAVFTALLGVLTIVVIGACKLILRWDALGTWGEYFLVALFITVGAMLLFSIVTLLGGLFRSFVGYHNFTITKHGNDIQIAFGLLERHTNTFSYDRIKAVKISQGLVQRMLGFAEIKLEVIGYTNDNGSDNNAELGVLVPFCKYDEIGTILNTVLPGYAPDEKQTKSVAYFPFVSWFALILGIVTGVVLLQTAVPMLIFGVNSSVIAAVLLALVGVGVLILAVKAVGAMLSYKNNGLAINGGKVTAYYGGFTRCITVFMAKNLVATEDVTTPLRQKVGITSLVMHLKTNALSNEVKVHIQSSALSEELEKLLIV